MIVKKTILLSVLLILATGVLACSKPRDAQSISEQEMNAESSSSTSQPAKPAGGGGKKLNANQW